VGDFEVDVGGGENPGSVPEPAGGGHGFYIRCFGGGVGLKFLDVGLVEEVEALLGFGVEGDGSG
jgi:hypothetical protein